MVRVRRGDDAARAARDGASDAHRVIRRNVEGIVEATAVVFERRHSVLVFEITEVVTRDIDLNQVLADRRRFARHGMHPRANDEHREKHEERARETAHDGGGEKAHASERTQRM